MRFRFILFILTFTVFSANAQKTAANEDKVKVYNTALELYDKQLYNAAISNFMEYLPFATDPVNISDVEYYIASCKLKLLHNNALANMLDFMSRYPNSRKLNNANLELGDYYFNIGKYRTALTYYREVSETALNKSERQTLAYRKGYCLFKSNKLKEAKEALKPLTNTDNPYKIEATYYYGYVCYLVQDCKEALRAFKTVEHKDIGATKLYIAEIYYLTDEYQKSIDYAKGKDFGELNNSRDLLVGKCHYRLGDYKTAEEYFERCHYDIEKLSPSEMYEIGYTYYANKNCIKSSILFEKIANTGNAMAQSASYHLGDCFLKVGKKQNAFNAFYEAQRTEFDKSIQEEAMFNYSKLAQELEYTSKAIMGFQKFIETFPKSKYKNDASKYLATLLYSTSDYKTAIEILENMNFSDETTKELYQKILFLRGQELFLQKDYSNAEEILKRSMTYKIDNGIYGECQFWIAEVQYVKLNYDKAREYYQKFVENVESKKTKYYPNALYGIAYTYYKQKKYAEAANYFNKYKTTIGYTLPENMFHDATLRLADCHFANGDYNAALDNYTYIISNRKGGSDYAMYQQGMIYGLQKKYSNKINILKKISRDFPNSPFIAEAIFQTGDVYEIQENYIEAERQYKYLIEDYPNSPWVKDCHVRLGSIYYRQGSYDKAIEEYKYIVSAYPGTAEAQKAIKNAEIVYKKQGQVREYLEWVKTVPNVNISTSKEDSLYYDAAFRKYSSGKYSAAITDFRDYLNNFNNGFFTLNANYYAALSYAELKDTNNSLPYLKHVADYRSSEFKEDAILRLCNIYIARRDCENGLAYYEALEKYGTNSYAMRKSLFNQILCLNKSNNREIAANKSRQLLKMDQITNAEKGLCNNSIALNLFMDSGYLNSAKARYRITIKNQQDVYAAEAKYYEALILFNLDSMDKCKKSINEYYHQFSNYTYWLGKTFILLSDHYLKKGDEFQAKATLNSVIENFDEQEIVDIAKQKLAAIENKNKKSNDSGEE
jgi:TolA-binding protein